MPPTALGEGGGLSCGLNMWRCFEKNLKQKSKFSKKIKNQKKSNSKKFKCLKPNQIFKKSTHTKGVFRDHCDEAIRFEVVSKKIFFSAW